MNKKYIDANIFIQAVLRDDKKSINILEKIIKKDFVAVTNILSWDELVFVIGKFLNRNVASIEGKKFLKFPNVEFIETKKETILKAQKLIEKYPLKPRDAIHAATAINLGIKEIISEDSDFDKIKELKRIF